MATLYDLSPRDIPHKELNKLAFRCYTKEEIEKLSVVEVTQTKTFDNAGFPVRNGLYDPLFGPTEMVDNCETCGLRAQYCPGHSGHMKLNMPVFNPMLFPITFEIMKGACVHCHKFFGTKEKQIKAVDLIDLKADEEEEKEPKPVDDAKSILKSKASCPHCKYRSPTIRNDFMTTMLLDFAAAKAKGLKNVKSKVKTANGESDDDENSKIDTFFNDSKSILTQSTLNMSKTKDTIELQLKQVRTGKVDKLAWRALEVRDHFRLLWLNENINLRKLYPFFGFIEEKCEKNCPMDVLFMETILIPPTKFRPVRFFAGQKYESSSTVIFRKILEADQLLSMVKMSLKSNKEFMNVKELLEARVHGKTLNEKLYSAYVALQQAANNLYDRDANPMSRGNGEKGLKQILEKKEGLFRMNMMGKRVNYACRSVITPDPYLDVDEIGIPEIFAKKLSFPEPFCYFNASKLRKQVETGPDSYPGANFVQKLGKPKEILAKEVERSGYARNLKAGDQSGTQNSSLVYRHLEKGDMMLMNRQPTLHRPSIMAHKARILTGQKALRMNYAPCKAYNADFDGDEMNGHFVQSKLGQTEAAELVSVGRNFLVPKDGTPILGLIQDHVVSGVLMTLRGRFFSKNDFMHLLLAAFGLPNIRLRLPPPAMLKPQIMWSGKQVVSAVMMNCVPVGYPLINLVGKAKSPLACWKVKGFDSPAFQMSESEVVFRQGELLCGVLDKSHYGTTQFGLIHCCFELYGPKIAVNILSCFSRLFIRYIQWHGFTLGVADILVNEEANAKRTTAIKKIRKSGPGAARKTFGFDENTSALRLKHAMASAYNNPRKDISEVKMLDFNVKQACGKLTEQINDACVPGGLIRSFPDNALQMMIQSGAKGSMVNSIQISCALGQIELEGQRPPLSAVGRTLPSFKCFDPSPRAGGFIDQRFLTGINPQELFFHTMAGREGLIDTAVKTSRSGYLQRCIIKHLEGITVGYDHTVRDHDNRIVQFRYGEDGMDVGKSSYMNPKQFPFLQQNLECLGVVVKPPGVRDADFNLSKTKKHFKKICRWKKKNSGAPRKQYVSGFTLFSAEMKGEDRDTVVYKWRNLTQEEREGWEEAAGKKCPSTMDDLFLPSKNLGALPEKVLDGIVNFSEDDDFKTTLFWKGMHSMADPGENVGLLAAQSIGEPSTQMTLNTFHFAGRGEMNVTLGIPRLREILMTAGANISTPMVEILIKPGTTTEQIEEIKRMFTPVTLKEVLKKFSVEERLVLKKGSSARQYSVTFELKRNKDREEHARHLSRQIIIQSIEKTISKMVGDQLTRNYKEVLEMEVMQHHKMKMTNQKILAEKEDEFEVTKKEPKKHRNDEESSDEEAEGGKEADASEARLNQRHHDDGAEYEGEEEEQKMDPIQDDDIVDSEGEDNEEAGLADALRIKNVIESHQQITEYRYDTKSHRWCTVVYELPLRTKTKLNVAGMVERVVEKAVVWKTHNIEKCITREDQRNGKDVQVLQTQKINVEALYKFSHILDVNTLYSNDINMMLKYYGIEACARVIFKEMNNVFGVYGIEVNPRHLTLVADHMTSLGSVQPFSRGAMVNNSSPLQKMTYETTLKFMRDTIIQGDIDELASPSARLVTGQTIHGGTGNFDILMNNTYMATPNIAKKNYEAMEH
ncbi:unnamed protein product [Bursaphelenchus okinawaensis]|uniref:DNA-directed RNA polymerase subunit n=1 Tax=Bursaphelenchus okinawaensis TaxID=465554 RepID=A0A811K7T4_9BILA|nr:unnamed protein product [Bursaphelenchus okinawaensis]CAG9093506.1 unnamed protein product [Bursaphelenchus okinawaensis]